VDALDRPQDPRRDLLSPELRLLPTDPTLRNFLDAFKLQPVGAWLLNSVLIAGAIAVGKLLVSLPAAYAFARYRFRGRSVLFALVVGTMIVPDVITIVPNYVLVARLDWINTPQGAVVPMVAFTGFYVFLLRQAMLAIPQEIFDAARVDGANAWTILWRVAFPLVRPAVAVVAVLSFLSALEPSPAYATGPLSDLLAWNGAAARFFGDFGAVPAERRNLLRLVFAEPSWKGLVSD
jgi:ABC-type glycerol-3-phosphate transport system permease component